MVKQGRLTSEHKAILRSSGWLSTRSPAFQEAFLELGFLKRLEAGQILYPRGLVPTHVHGLIRGQIDVKLLAPNGEELAYPSGRQNKWFSFADVLTKEPAVGLAIARQPSDLLCISRRDLVQFLDGHPRNYVDIIAHDNALRREMQRILTEVMTVDGVELVARRLARMAENGGLDANNSVATSQMDFALAVGVSVPTVQRAFRDLKRKGIIETNYGKITVRDPLALSRFADALGLD